MHKCNFLSSLWRPLRLNFFVSCGEQNRLSSRVISRRYTQESTFDKLFSFANPDTHVYKNESAGNAIYEFQFEDVKPKYREEYMTRTSLMNSQLHEDEAYPGELVLSLKAIYGNQDQALHVWKYSNGFNAIAERMNYFYGNEELNKLEVEKKKWCYWRNNQVCKTFDYFPFNVAARGIDNIYELRTYSLKPGSLVEWGNQWAKIKGLPSEEIMAAFFSDVGYLYMVHHLWSYEDMQDRVEVRESMWFVEGWTECVANTCRLLRHSKSQIFVPISS